MKFDILSIDGKKQSIDVMDKIFAAKPNKKAISDVIFKMNTNLKGRKAKTKQKNQIIGSTSKIYAQKGTGNARHASRKAPIFVGGGVAHGPKGEKAYKKRKINKKEKRLSIVSALSEKTYNKDLIILNDFNVEIKKTKEMYKLIKDLNMNNSLFLLDKNSKLKIEKSIRNIPNVKVTDTNHFSTFDLIKFKKLVLTETSLKEIEKRFS